VVIQVAERAAYHRIQGLPALERCLRWCGHHRVFKHTCPRTDYSASGVDDSPRRALKACRVIRETSWHTPEGCARLFAHYRGHIPGSSQPPWGRGQNLAPALGTGHTRRWYSVDSPFSQGSTNASDHAVSCHHSGDNIRGCSLVLTDRRQHHQSDSKRLWWGPNLYRIQPGALCVPDRRKLERCGPVPSGSDQCGPERGVPPRGEPDGRDAGGRDPELGRSDRGGADLGGADLHQANLSGAIFTDAEYWTTTNWAGAFYYINNVPVWDSGMDPMALGILALAPIPEPTTLLLALLALAAVPYSKRHG